jgi:hypothetical protein
MERQQTNLDPWFNSFVTCAAVVLRDAEESTYAKDAGLDPALHPDVASLALPLPVDEDPRTKADKYYPGRYAEVHLL